MNLNSLSARKILNSRKEETIEVVAEVGGKKVIASAPSGKSRGRHEVRAFSSKGIDFSVSFANTIGKEMIDKRISF